MHVCEETITPKKARELLDKHLVPDHQRRPSLSLVQDYARMMRAGQWLLTHQGIAIDDSGELIDGQQRLLAIEQAGVPVRMLIARGVPANGAEKHHGVLTIDAVDRGRPRSVGQQLTLRHGWDNGVLAQAAASAILSIACRTAGISVGRADVGKSLQVLAIFQSELKHCLENRTTIPGLRIGSVIGAFAFAMRLYPNEIKEAYARFVSGERMERTDPMLTLRNFLLRRGGATNGGTALDIVRATLQALEFVVTGKPIARVNSDVEGGVQFFATKQKPTVNKLLVACGYIEKVV